MPANTPRGYSYPLYGDPTDFPAQMQDFAQDVDTDVAALVAAGMAALNTPSVAISGSANQAIVSGIPAFATFDTEDYDNAAMANLGVNNDRITFTTAGIYLITAMVNFAPNGNATVNGRQMAIERGGVNITWEIEQGSQNIDTTLNTTYLHEAAGGTFMRLEVRHDSGANVNIDSRTFTATRVAD